MIVVSVASASTYRLGQPPLVRVLAAQRKGRQTVMQAAALGDTRAVLDATRGLAKPEVLFVGAGFIGFIVLNAMYKRGWKLHVVEIAGHVLPRMLDADSAGLVETWLKQKGVALA